MPTAGELIRAARERQRRSVCEVARTVGLTLEELVLIEQDAAVLWSKDAWFLARTLDLDIELLCEAAAANEAGKA